MKGSTYAVVIIHLKPGHISFERSLVPYLMKEPDAAISPVPSIYSVIGSTEINPARPLVTKISPSARPLPHSNIRIYKNGKFIGTATRWIVIAILAVSPPGDILPHR